MNNVVNQYKITNKGLKKTKPAQKHGWIAIDATTHKDFKQFCKKNKLTMKVAAELAVLNFMDGHSGLVVVDVETEENEERNTHAVSEV